MTQQETSNLTPQHKQLINWLWDKGWHCTTEIEYIRDHRKRISELNKMGFSIHGERCSLHTNHRSGVKMRRLLPLSQEAWKIVQRNQRNPDFIPGLGKLLSYEQLKEMGTVN